MNKALLTREKLLTQARDLMWAKGYSNVSVREISKAAGVDVALISRYFGGKRGLFEETIKDAFRPPVDAIPTPDDLVDIIVQIFTQAPRDHATPSVIQLMFMNAHDAEVGGLVRRLQAEQMQSALEAVIGDRQKAALFMAAILGFSVAEKSLHLEGIAPHDTQTYEAQLRHVLNAALRFEAP